MMELIEQELSRAISRLNRSPIQKLFSPGLHKFLSRQVARIRNEPVAKKTKLFFGGQMEVVLPEVISEAIYTYGVFDEVVTWLSIINIRKGDAVLDIGAHFGYFSLLFSHLVGESGKVFAFEPTVSTFNILKRNTSAAGNITALNLAIGCESGELTMKDHGIKYSAFNSAAEEPRLKNVLNSRECKFVKVKAIKMDDFLTRHAVRPNFIKIDTENFEEQVVSGLAETLKKDRPKIILECGGSPFSLRATQALVSMGYSPWVSNGLNSLFSWQESLELANSKYKDILFLPLTPHE